MPELDIQHRPSSGMGWLPWVIGAVLLALIAWGVYEVVTPERAEAPIVTDDRVAGQREETPAVGVEPGVEAGLPVAAILQAPNTYFGQPVQGSAMVTEVVSDRGFWIESDGNRMFVVKDEAIPEYGMEVNAGQRIQIDGTVRDTQQVGEAPGVAAMEEQTRQIIQDQPAYIHATNLTVLERPGDQGTMTTPGTDGTETTPEPGMTNSQGTTNDTGTNTMPGTP